MAIAVRHTVLVGHRERREGNGPKTARQPEDTQGAKAGPERRGRCGPQEETSIRTAEVLRPLLERASPSGSRAGSRGRALSCRKGEGYGPVREATEGEGRKETHAQAAGAPPWDRLPGPGEGRKASWRHRRTRHALPLPPRRGGQPRRGLPLARLEGEVSREYAEFRAERMGQSVPS